MIATPKNEIYKTRCIQICIAAMHGEAVRWEMRVAADWGSGPRGWRGEGGGVLELFGLVKEEKGGLQRKIAITARILAAPCNQSTTLKKIFNINTAVENTY